MFDPRHVSKDFSDAAARYDAHAVLQQRVLAELIHKGLPLLQPHAQLLDMGCGTGQFACQAQDHAVIQLDIAYAMCVKAAENKMPTVNGTVAVLPFADATFDGVFSSLVLQWVPDWRQAMQEMRRVLKPGGVLAVSTFGPNTLKELKESFASADRYSHVSSFIPRAEFEQSETVMEYYPDMLAVMRQLKAIGARNKLMGRRKSLMTPGQMRRVERRYVERFAKPEGLPVTWEILYSVSRKL